VDPSPGSVIEAPDVLREALASASITGSAMKRAA
jgi:hypothetical protein